MKPEILFKKMHIAVRAELFERYFEIRYFENFELYTIKFHGILNLNQLSPAAVSSYREIVLFLRRRKAIARLGIASERAGEALRDMVLNIQKNKPRDLNYICDECGYLISYLERKLLFLKMCPQCNEQYVSHFIKQQSTQGKNGDKKAKSKRPAKRIEG